MTCSAAHFENPYADAIVEQLVADPDAGVIAFWSMTGWSLNNLSDHLNQDFFAALFSGGHGRLGDAMLAALESYGAKGLDPYMLDITVLIGDPE